MAGDVMDQGDNGTLPHDGRARWAVMCRPPPADVVRGLMFRYADVVEQEGGESVAGFKFRHRCIIDFEAIHPICRRQR